MFFGSKRLVPLFLLLWLVACGDDESSGGNTGTPVADEKTISGVVQKGPYAKGASVSVHELDAGMLLLTGNHYEGKVQNDSGAYSVTFDEFDSPYAILEASGLFRNELTGAKTKSSVTLYAVTDLSERDSVNVNLLTHLEYARVLYLVTVKHMSFSEAKAQAEREVMAAFGIKGDFGLAEDLNAFGNGDGSAALLAMSVLVLGCLNTESGPFSLGNPKGGAGEESKLSERLSNMVFDIEKDGEWNDKSTIVKIADWAANQSMEGGLDSIRETVASWKMSKKVPAFEKYVDNFWRMAYGFDVCDGKRENEARRNMNPKSAMEGVYFVCQNGKWVSEEYLEDDSDTTDVKDTTENRDTVSFDYGKLVDARDGQAYRTIEIGIQNWMADDLNYGGSSEYYWDDAKEVCPAGWHLPSKEEWDYLFRSIGSTSQSELDKRGFAARPAGLLGVSYWTSSYDKDSQGRYPYDIFFSSTGTGMSKLHDSTSRFPVRCVQDYETLSACDEENLHRVARYNNMVYYVCEEDGWHMMNYDEYNEFKWTGAVEGKTLWDGSDPRMCYVYDNGAWYERDSSNCKLGLGGCTAARQGELSRSSKSVWYTCDNGTWVGTMDSTVDQIMLGTDYDEGTVVKCPSNGRYCVFQDGHWREGTKMDSVLYALGGTPCMVEGDTSKVKYAGEYYVCRYVSWRAVHMQWETAPLIYSDTYEDRDECSATGLYGDGSFHNKHDNATGRVYVCENGGFRLPTEREMSLNLGCTSYIYGKKITVNNTHFVCGEEGWKIDSTAWEYGSFTDARDGRVYKTIDIWGQTWMAENLDYRDSVSKPELEGNRWCYDNEAEQCDTYGSFYSCELSSQVCPAGWHLPSISDWFELYNFIVLMGGDPQNGLRAKEGWSDNTGHSRNGTDVLGFTALPGGIMYEVGSYGDATRQAWFWYAQDCSLNEYEAFYLSSEEVNFVSSSVSNGKITEAYSIRCIKD
ncbi:MULTISPECIES: FISUMP domain-containing protein [unclassified Fibrobacter]|uniref:FISUMP domain-containing protein n=1 Tax=unclassified Fibrobacter TaxID=2634177 RepID=UPI0025BC57C4|nr:MULTISPECIES: FISUMP domain-containing protein [unclassified Fibrobacter]